MDNPFAAVQYQGAMQAMPPSNDLMNNAGGQAMAGYGNMPYHQFARENPNTAAASSWGMMVLRSALPDLFGGNPQMLDKGVATAIQAGGITGNGRRITGPGAWTNMTASALREGVNDVIYAPDGHTFSGAARGFNASDIGDAMEFAASRGTFSGINPISEQSLKIPANAAQLQADIKAAKLAKNDKLVNALLEAEKLGVGLVVDPTQMGDFKERLTGTLGFMSSLRQAMGPGMTPSEMGMAAESMTGKSLSSNEGVKAALQAVRDLGAQAKAAGVNAPELFRAAQGAKTAAAYGLESRGEDLMAANGAMAGMTTTATEIGIAVSRDNEIARKRDPSIRRINIDEATQQAAGGMAQGLLNNDAAVAYLSLSTENGGQVSEAGRQALELMKRNPEEGSAAFNKLLKQDFKVDSARAYNDSVGGRAAAFNRMDSSTQKDLSYAFVGQAQTFAHRNAEELVKNGMMQRLGIDGTDGAKQLNDFMGGVVHTLDAGDQSKVMEAIKAGGDVQKAVGDIMWQTPGKYTDDQIVNMSKDVGVYDSWARKHGGKLDEEIGRYARGINEHNRDSTGTVSGAQIDNIRQDISGAKQAAAAQPIGDPQPTGMGSRLTRKFIEGLTGQESSDVLLEREKSGKIPFKSAANEPGQHTMESRLRGTLDDLEDKGRAGGSDGTTVGALKDLDESPRSQVAEAKREAHTMEERMDGNKKEGDVVQLVRIVNFDELPNQRIA